MKKNLIIRKRHLLTIPILLIVMCLSGCTPQLTVETYTHEAGEVLPEEATAYAEFENPENAKEAIVDVSGVDPDKVGTYEAAIMLNEKEYPFTVEVVDTTAPEGTFNVLVVTCGIDEKVTIELFEHMTTDVSEVKYGLRNASLLMNEEELKELIRTNLEEAEEAGLDQISYMEMVDVTWNKETDTWEEKNVSWDSFDNEFVPEENGLYRLEQLCVDEYGNADVSYGYVIADLTAPVFTQVDDLEVKMTDNFEEYMSSLNDGLAVEDNYLGDITYTVEVTNTEAVDTESSDMAMKVYYKVEDIAGNKAEASRNLSYGKTEEPKAMGSVYGPKLTQAELNELDAAVQNFLSNYITPGMTDYQKVRVANDFLCNTVTYADSWAYNGANTAWGALVYHEAQCSGYARAMKALCDGMGVGCYYIHSSTTSHQWNEVCVDGNWYIIDVTANDTGWRDAVFLASESSFVNFWNGQGYSEDWDRSSVPSCPNDY